MEKWLLLFLVACAVQPTISFDNGSTFSVEYAQTDEERAKGLMFKESMADDEGMLFIFDEEKSRRFWMKNTLIPLDIIFLDENKTVVFIHENAQPCKEDPCKLYESPPAKYVFEINGGLTKKKNIVIGSQLR